MFNEPILTISIIYYRYKIGYSKTIPWGPGNGNWGLGTGD